MNIREIRYRHSQELMKPGGVSAFAKKIGKSQSQVSQFAGKNPNKGIGDRMARHIESVYNLPHGYMDKEKPEWRDSTLPENTDQKRIQELQAENDRLKKMFAEVSLENQKLKLSNPKKAK